ncbi:calponin homology domain-containing protein DDB_G0272472-like [Culicoides brevitarsis]|uniref:calponin homology domain-containing protein DDB_G0272472-like n=1 Tax=Culicoides brevitarsis TaxID=469753 RepID=UPI00307B842C
MVNKKLKKKTKWHPLSLAAGTKDGEEGKVDDAKSASIPFKMEWKINHNGENNYYRNNLSSSNANSASHHNYNNNNNNHPHQQRFDKRASKSYSKSHHTNDYSFNNTTGGNSDNKLGKQEHQSHKDFPKKVQFNEDEYTRITTPRQDVLFKKGYLSRPKTQPVTPTHQPYNNVPVDGFYPGAYITADSPPLAINGALTPPNGADYPFIPAGHGAFMSDALNNVYGNPVFFMPYHQDIFYPPSDLEIGDTYNMYNNNLYSPPLLEEQDGSVSQPVTSATSTNCSDESESSEEVVTTATEPTEASTEISAPEKETETAQNPEETSVEKTVEDQETPKTEENPEEVVTNVSPGCFENGYDSLNPYLNPYTPVYYYPMPFYPVPPMGPYSPNEFYQSPEVVAGANGFGGGVENGRYNKYPKRKKRYRKTLSSSGTSITDYSEDESMGQHEAMTNSGSGDSGFTDATATKNELPAEKHPMAPCTPELSINEIIAHQSTLNVEVPEFRPKQSQPITNGFYNTSSYNKHNYYNNNKKTWYHSNRETTREKSTKTPSTQLVEEKTKQTKSNISVRKPLADKKLQSSEIPVVVENTVNNVNNGNSTKPSIKKRPTNPVLEKKILIESTKNIEMQNIDLMKSKIETLTRNDVRIETTWVVVGGKRKMIQEEIPIEREKTKEETKNEPETNSIDVSPSLPAVVTTTNNGQAKKPSRKAKQKNKPQHKRNAQQGKNTKLQGFVIEEPTFTSVEQKTQVPQTNGDDNESDAEELLEAAQIEAIPWTEADIGDAVSDEKLSDLSEASSASTSIIVNNTEINETEPEQTTDCSQNDQKQEPTCDEEPMHERILDQTKAEVLEVAEIAADTNCSRPVQDEIEEKVVVVVPEEDKSQTYFQKTDKTIEIVESLIITEEKSSPKLANGITNHIAVVVEEPTETETAVKEEICAKLNHVTCETLPEKVEKCPEETSDAAILEINEPPKYSLTTAVHKWLSTFNNNDLQSLFTIPLSPDFVEKMKHCTEISQYFADDELQRLDTFINENFRYDSHMSAASSLSSLLSDITDGDYDIEDEDDTSQNARSTHKKALKKYFGCEIM